MNFKSKYIYNNHAYIIAGFTVILCVCYFCIFQVSNDKYISLDDTTVYHSDVDFSKDSGLFLLSGQILNKNNRYITVIPDSILHTIDLSFMFQSEQLHGNKLTINFNLSPKSETKTSVLFKQYSNSYKTTDDFAITNNSNSNNFKIDFHHNDSTLAYVLNFKITSKDIVTLKNISIQIDDTNISNVFRKNRFIDEKKLETDFTGIDSIRLDSIMINRLYLICKIWGFLKYYHPAVNQGKYNWDKELFNVIIRMTNIKDDEYFRNSLLDWINSLDMETSSYCSNHTAGLLLYEKDLSWITNTSKLGETISSKLLQILYMNRNFKYNYYINPSLLECTAYERELTHEEMEYSDLSTRLLSLFRFWNFIEYCYPYRSLIENWDTCLMTYLPKFASSNNESDFVRHLMSLCSNIKDSHISVFSKEASLPFNIKRHRLYIDTKVTDSNNYLVYKSWHPEIKTGDLITAINNVPVRELIDSLALYTSASNRKSMFCKLSPAIFSSDLPEMHISIMRDKKKLKKTINLDANQYHITDDMQIDIDKLLSQGILYIKSSNEIENIENYFSNSLKSINGMILDLRSYPSKYFFNYIFSKLVCTNNSFAWSFYNTSLSPGSFNLIKKHRICDYVQSKGSSFSGKIVVIVDENTISHGEYLCMALQSLPNCTVIGSQSSGTIGNTAILRLPGNISVMYTKTAVCYPDLTQIQQTGVKIDYKIELDMKSLIEHKDNYIEFATKMINNK